MNKEVEQIPYENFVAALIKPGEQIVKETTAAQANLSHLANALLIEVIELKQAIFTKVPESKDEDSYVSFYNRYNNIIEEMGDILFYVTGIAKQLNVSLDLEDKVSPANQVSIDVLEDYAAELADLVKKHHIYQKPLDTTIVEILCTRIADYIHNLCSDIRYSYFFDVKMSFIIAKNKEKLSKRYEKLTFSNQAAQTRADKQ